MMIQKQATQYFGADRPVLPEWTRWSWRSLDERDYWKTKVSNASRAWNEIERWSVVKGVRPGAYQFINPGELTSTVQWGLKYGITVIPIEQAATPSGYASGNVTRSDGQTSYRVLFLRPENIGVIPSLNDESIGKLLGYPQCCRDFFARTWGAGQIDTTYDQHMASQGRVYNANCNMLWRWLGIRWVSHLPCSNHCEHTVELALKTRRMALELGYVEEVSTIDTITKTWPVSWSGLNGIGEIFGPCIRVSTRTDWHPELRSFSRPGTYIKPDSATWKLNGFSTYEAMDTAHKPLIETLKEFVPKGAHVYDPGCGTGRLLQTLLRHRPDVSISGVDINADAIAKAESIGVGSWKVGPIGNTPWPEKPTDTLVLMPGRLLELQQHHPEWFDAELERVKSVPQIIVYTYSDWKDGHLNDVCARLGLPRPAITHASSHVTVAVCSRD